MCVHIFQVTGMPNGVLVWVDTHAPHTAVYVDESLYGEDGELSAAGELEATRAVSAQRLASDPAVAQSSGRAALRAVAG